jgi:hypothetical protein
MHVVSLGKQQYVAWSNGVLLFPEKEAKSVVLLRRRFGDPKLGEADPGGLGASPQRLHRLVELFFFQKKKQKALFCFAEGLLIQNFINRAPL